MKRTALTLILLLTACADGTTDDDTFGEETSIPTATSDDASEDGTGSSDEAGVGTGDSSETGTSEGGDGDNGDGDTDAGDGDGDVSGDGDGDESDATTGDGDGDGGLGEMKFPGDACDPFIDWCIDGYGCDPMDGIQFPIAEFRCKEQFPVVGQDMQYGSLCSTSANCVEGLLCISAQDFPDGDCDVNAGTKCCMDICVYEETCANGNACQVTWWQADLEDYLDIYTGIGDCGEQ